MPKYGITAALASLPTGLKDAEAAMVSPLYLAINKLARDVSVATGNVSLDAAELVSYNATVGLIAGRQQQLTAKAASAIGYGQVVTITHSGTEFVATLATSAMTVHGICNNPAGVAINEFFPVLFLNGLCAGVTGTTVGAKYYSSGTAGILVPGPSATQFVGIGMGGAGLYFCPQF